MSDRPEHPEQINGREVVEFAKRLSDDLGANCLTELALCTCALGEFGGAALWQGSDPGVAYSPSSRRFTKAAARGR